MCSLRTTLLVGAVLSATFATTIADRATASSTHPECEEPAVPLHEIQGVAKSSPMLGLDVTVDAIVVGAFPRWPNGLGGFFVQEEDADVDDDPATSEGLFVFASERTEQVEPGDRVRVSGRVSEFFGMTELTHVSELLHCPSRGKASATSVALPVADSGDWERWEGMLVVLEQPLVATGLYNLGRFGEVELAAGSRLFQPTHREAPGEPGLAVAESNLRRSILLDDGSDATNPTPTPYLDLSRGGTLRIGDTLAGVEGVVEFAFGSFRVHPTRSASFKRRATPRSEEPPEVDGTLRVVAWNVENHFNGDGRGGGFPTRGPRTQTELERQRKKLVETLVRLQPDIAALVELENDGTGPESALGQLVRALNERTAGAPYSVIDPGEPRLGKHAIAVGLLYRADVVDPIGATAILDARAHIDFDDTRNRPSLAQAFETRATGQRVTIVVNHFKSKGSSCDSAGDPDPGDAQGNCNGTRARAATALTEWLDRTPSGISDAPSLIVGDLNAYPREDPIRVLKEAGYADLLQWFGGPDAYTYVFDGAAGRLDYALARPELMASVAGAAVWHTNADEPRLFDYDTDNPGERYAPGPFRASDHDPVLIGLFPTMHTGSCKRTAHLRHPKQKAGDRSSRIKKSKERSRRYSTLAARYPCQFAR